MTIHSQRNSGLSQTFLRAPSASLTTVAVPFDTRALTRADLLSAIAVDSQREGKERRTGALAIFEERGATLRDSSNIH